MYTGANDPFGWQRIVRESVDEMLRLVDVAEDYVYDYVFPALYESAGTDAERQFYGSLNWDSLQQLSPKLYMNYSMRALDLEQNQRAEAAKKLDELDFSEYEQGRSFRPQVSPRPILGLKAPGTTPATTGAAGLDRMPMGMLGGGI